MKRGLILLAVLLALGAVGAFAWNKYSTVHRELTRQRSTMGAVWTELDSALKARAEAMAALASIVREVAPKESAVAQSSDDARSAFAAGPSPSEKLQAYSKLESALGRLLLITEGYPKLWTDKRFRRVDDDLKQTESSIQKARLRYNEAVQRYNATIEQFPLAAGIAGFSRNDAYFTTKVQF